MDIVVSAGSRLTSETLATHVVTSRPVECRVDTERTSFVDPAGLVAIAAVIERAAQESRRITFVSPANFACRSYLSRMQLGRLLEELDIAHDLETVTARDLGDRLRELRRFRSESGIEEVAEQVVRLFAKSSPTQDLDSALYRAVFEFGVNAVEHSAQDGGFLALQAFPGSGDVVFAVADSGRGIRAALSEAGSITSDETAIRQAARKYESRLGTPGRGRGITGVIDLTAQRRGVVTLISGRAQGDFTNGHWDPRVTTLPSRFRGTLAQARLALQRRLEP